MMNREKQISSNKTPKRYGLLVLSCTTIFLLGLLIVRYYHIQIDENNKWTAAARRQHFFVVDEPFLRGTFYSNPLLNRPHLDVPKKLVVDIPKFHLYADPKSLPYHLLADIANCLQQQLKLSKKQQKHLFEQLNNRRSRSRKLLPWLDTETKENLLNWWYPYAKIHQLPKNALYFLSDYQRSYPYGSLAGQILQTVQHARDEKTGQATPTGGLELSLDSYLRGKKGKRLLMRSPRNVLETDQIIEAPENGADVYLSINLMIQAIAENEVKKAVQRTKAKAGWAVIMDPYTGDILALAQYPPYSPACYTDYFNHPEKREESKVKAITDAHEPGSIMKPITLAIAFLANEELINRGETPLFDPKEKMATKDGKFPGRRPLKEVTYHSYLNMNMALHRSSNIYVARLVQRIIDRLGAAWYRRQLNEIFGFGAKTHIELPGESAGVLPTPGKKHLSGALEWSVPTPFSLAMGHNLQATTIQLLRAYALFANGGFLIQPTLIKNIVRERGSNKENLYDSSKDPLLFPKLLHSDIIDPVVLAMKYVTKKGGSAFRAEIPGFTECGKTGTAEKIVHGKYSKDDHVSTCIGFAPVSNPIFVLSVTIDEPEKGYIPGVGKNHMGSYAAAPLFREIGKRVLAYLGTVPDDPHGYPLGDPRYDPEKADWITEVETLRKDYQEWNK